MSSNNNENNQVDTLGIISIGMDGQSGIARSQVRYFALGMRVFGFHETAEWHLPRPRRRGIFLSHVKLNGVTDVAGFRNSKKMRHNAQ